MSDTRDRLEALLRERIVVLDGAWGTMLQRRRARGRGLPGRALRRPPARGCRRPRPAEPDAARRRPRHPPPLPGGGRRHHDDEHVHRDLDRPGGLRARGRRPRAERRRRTAGPPGCGRGRRPLRRRVAGAAERDALALAEGRRSGLPRRHVRPGRRVVRRADPRPARGRRRPAPDRDDLRHAEREGGDRRRQGRRARAAALDLGHDRRPLRPHALGPDRRGVLELDRGGEAADRRRQLLARARRRCDRMSKSSPGSRARTRARIRTQGCRTPSAATTSSRTTRPSCSAPLRARASSTSSAAAAARRRTTRVQSQRPSGICRRATSRNGPLARASAAWSRSRSAPTPAS